MSGIVFRPSGYSTRKLIARWRYPIKFTGRTFFSGVLGVGYSMW